MRRSGIDARDSQALAAAGALASLVGHRHRAQWDLLGVERLPELLENASANEPVLDLPDPSDGQDIVADYQSLGLALGRHPLALLRPRLAALQLIDSINWAAVPDGRPASIAGLVKCRQRPGSAHGVMFTTIEDEGGPVNVIVWPDVVERYRREVLGSRLLAVHGVTQREQGVVHLVAGRLEDLSALLGELVPKARSFH